MTMLQVFLIINAFLVGVAVSLAIRYALAHYRQKPAPAPVRPSNTPQMPQEMKDRLLKMAESNFTGIVNRSALQLKTDLGATGEQLNRLLEKFGTEILDDEMKLFRANVDDIRKQTEATIGVSQKDIVTRQTEVMNEIAKQQEGFATALSAKQQELTTRLAEEMAAEKARFKTELDQKLSDAVNSFLVETLGNNVDLGNQTEYLVAMLEENKENLIKGVVDEA